MQASVELLVSQGGLCGRVGGMDGEIHEKRSILAFLASNEVLCETRERVIEVGVSLVRDQLPVLVQLGFPHDPVPFVPPLRDVFGSVAAVAVEVLAEKDCLVTRVVEPGGQRRSLAPQLAEGLETPERGPAAPDQMVVWVLPGQDRGSGGTAERIGNEGVVEGFTLVGHVRFERRYLRDRRGVQVVGEYENN